MKITLKFTLDGDTENVWVETIEGDDLLDERNLWEHVNSKGVRDGATTFEKWWKPGTFYYSALQDFNDADHGVRGFVEGVLDSMDCPMWLYRAMDFQVEVTVD